MRRFYLILLAGILMAVFIPSQDAYAEIALSPLRKTIQVARGESKAVKYAVENKGDKPIEIEISAKNWFVLPDNKEIEISDWLNLGVDKITLAKGQKKQLNFKVSVPKEAIGELAGMIYFKPRAKEDTTLVTSYGVSLYVFVKGTEVVNVEIGDILLTSREAKNYIAVEILNKGNVHVRPYVKALIENEKGLKEKIELPFGKPIFGRQIYTFVGEIKDLTLEKGTYKITALVDYGDKENIITKPKEVKIDGSSE